MTMRTLVPALFAALSLAGVETTRINAFYHNANAMYGKAEYFRIENKFNRYLVYYQWIKSTPKEDGRVVVGLPEPSFWNGFVSRDFTALSVNGVSSTQLEPKEFRIVPNGVEVRYNFDGVKMSQCFYMRENSPLLFMEWRKDPACTEKIEKMELSLSVYPSYSLPVGGKRDNRYRREIRTVSRKLTSQDKTSWFTFEPREHMLDLYDSAYEPPATPKAQGPCMLGWDPAGIASARVWFGNVYCMNFKFILNPEAGTWKFALFEHKKPMGNAEYFEYRAKHDFSL